MTEEQEPIKIVIPVEEEVPFVPEQPRGLTKDRAQDAGRKLINLTRRGVDKAWNSRIRRGTTSKVKKGTAVVFTKGSRLVQERFIKSAERQTRRTATAMHDRIRSTDWKREASQGTAKGLQWASRKLAQLADKFTPVQEHSAGFADQKPRE